MALWSIEHPIISWCLYIDARWGNCLSHDCVADLLVRRHDIYEYMSFFLTDWNVVRWEC